MKIKKNTSYEPSDSEKFMNPKQIEYFKNLFLINSKETIADWAIWPFVRQFRIADIKKFDQNHEIQHVQSWLNYFFTHEKYPAVQNFPRFLSLLPISLLNSAVSAITKSN